MVENCLSRSAVTAASGRWRGIRAGAAAAKVRIQILLLRINCIDRRFHRGELVRQFGLFTGDLRVQIIDARGEGCHLFAQAGLIVGQESGRAVHEADSAAPAIPKYCRRS